MGIRFCWLGIAGIELTYEEQTVVIDPCFTRPSFLRLWLDRVEPAHALTAQHIAACNQVLVTHAHYDHLMDVPDVVRNTRAAVYGSPNTCRLLEICGAPQERIHSLAVGDRVDLGHFRVEVLPAKHGKVPGFAPGPLAAGLRPQLPLWIRDYRMDTCFSFLIEVGGRRLLDWGGSQATDAPRADVLFTAPLGPRPAMEALLRSARPQVVIPIHWDDLFRPLSRPSRPMLAPPRLAWPPLRRMDPAGLAAIVDAVLPGAATIVPEALHTYEL